MPPPDLITQIDLIHLPLLFVLLKRGQSNLSRKHLVLSGLHLGFDNPNLVVDDLNEVLFFQDVTAADTKDPEELSEK